MRTRTLLGVTAATAVVAIATALFYVGSDPAPLALGTILATIFGVGLSILVAGGLMALMYFSDASGRDDVVGRGTRRRG